MGKAIHKRPRIHFTPKSGWSNDPNGLTYIDGTYHMFFQYYPDATHWGPMHWGHAVSTDLLHWEELPIALYPDEFGLIFSGSCFYDKENKSGLASMEIPVFGIKAKPPLIAMYTSHMIVPYVDMSKDYEQQSIAYSTDLVHFEKFSGNPVISGRRHDFRDPKMFWNPVKNCFSMVVAADDCLEFYRSENLKDWEKSGAFYPMECGGIKGISECPDCFPLTAEDGTEKWVLTMSLIVPKKDFRKHDSIYDRATNLSQYFVGEFDGDKFVCTEPRAHAVLLDGGIDNYAAVTYHNTEDTILVGWGNNPMYASHCLNDGFNGRMTLPRKLGLKKTVDGYRLTQEFMALEQYQQKAEKLTAGINKTAYEAFGIRVTGGSCGKVILSNEQGEKLVIELTEKEIIVDRTEAGEKDFDKDFARLSVSSVERLYPQDAAMEIIWDLNSVEVLADQKTASITSLAWPIYDYNTIELIGDLTAEIYEVK